MKFSNRIRQLLCPPQAKKFVTPLSKILLRLRSPGNNNSILRNVSLRYNSQDPITVNIYTDGDEANPVFTKIAPTQTGEELFNKSFRVGRRAKYFMVELLTSATANYDTTIASLEVKVDG